MSLPFGAQPSLESGWSSFFPLPFFVILMCKAPKRNKQTNENKRTNKPKDKFMRRREVRARIFSVIIEIKTHADSNSHKKKKKIRSPS